MNSKTETVLDLLPFEPLKKLFDKGASIETNNNGYNALHAAVMMSIDIKEKITFLLGKNIHVNSKDYNTPFANTPLHILIINEMHQEATFFIKSAAQKIDFSVGDSEGKTSLITATKINSTAITQALLDEISQNINIINQQDNKGMTALHYACLYGNETVVKALIAAGGSMEILNKEGRKPLDCTALGEKKIREALTSVVINADRDEKASHNDFRDEWLQPLIAELPNGIQMLEIPMQKTNEEEMMKLLAFPLIDSKTLAHGQKSFRKNNDYFVQAVKNLTGVSLITTLTRNS